MEEQELETVVIDGTNLKYSEKEILDVYKHALMMQKEKVKNLTIYDDEYKQELTLLMTMEDAYRRRKPKADWKFILTYILDVLKTVGTIGLGIGTMYMTYKTAELSWTSAEEMKMCDGRVYNLASKMNDANKWNL
jgi:ABC-type phosphonate transport system ATPase subunit